MTKASSSRTQGGLLLLALLCVSLGVAVDRTLLQTSPKAERSYLSALRADLQLRPDQVTKIEMILNREDQVLEALWEDHVEQLRTPVAESRRRTEQEILVVLDEKQRRRFKDLSLPQ